jgi:hypothetical protein
VINPFRRISVFKGDNLKVLLDCLIERASASVGICYTDASSTVTGVFFRSSLQLYKFKKKD